MAQGKAHKGAPCMISDISWRVRRCAWRFGLAERRSHAVVGETYQEGEK